LPEENSNCNPSFFLHWDKMDKQELTTALRYPSTLAAWTIIILIKKKIEINFKEKTFAKVKREFFEIFMNIYV